MKKISTLLTFLVAVFMLMSCAKKMTFLPSSMVPTAEGTVKVKSDKNTNYAIDLEVINLVSPDKLPQPKSNYVVWAQTENSGVKNIGVLKSTQGVFSKAWKGSLETVMPFKPEKVFITAEDDVNPTTPGPEIVLNTKSFEVK